MARAIQPVHTPYDGDTIFVLATGAWSLPDPAEHALMRIGAAAADCVARSVMRGVYLADGGGEPTSYRDRFKGG